MNDAPRMLTAPDGTVLAPVRVLLCDGLLRVEDRDGTLLASDTDASVVSSGTRITTIEGASGRWSSRTLCSCGARQRQMLAEWYGNG